MLPSFSSFFFSSVLPFFLFLYVAICACVVLRLCLNACAITWPSPALQQNKKALFFPPFFHFFRTFFPLVFDAI